MYIAVINYNSGCISVSIPFFFFFFSPAILNLSLPPGGTVFLQERQRTREQDTALR